METLKGGNKLQYFTSKDCVFSIHTLAIFSFHLLPHPLLTLKVKVLILLDFKHAFIYELLGIYNNT